MRRADRLFRLVQILRNKRLVAARELAERLEVGMVLAKVYAEGAPEHSGNPLYLLHVSANAYGLCLAILDGVVDPGDHVVCG